MDQSTIKKLTIYAICGTAGGILGYFVGNLIVDRIIEQENESEKWSEEVVKELIEKGTKKIEETEKKLDEKIKQNGAKKDKVDYTKHFPEKGKLEDLAASYKSSVNDDYKKAVEEKKNESPIDGPYIITLEEYTNEHPEFSKVSLSYYAEDDTLADPNEDIIADRKQVIGEETLAHFGEGSEDADIVFVRNMNTSTDYEVSRLHSSYSTTVLGMPPKKINKGNRKVKKNDDPNPEE